MTNAVVICEFNPLHIGHAKLLAKARETGAENVICVMSGNAVQRGELACLDKYTRAKHALLAGADAVIELPAEYTLSAAPLFALGGVKTANNIRDAVLVFGSECGDIAALERLASVTDDRDVNARIKEAVKKGMGYPAAVAEATGENDLLCKPNNTLGMEYIRAIVNTGRKISAFTVKRENAPDADAPHGYPTSSSLREAAKEGLCVDPYLLPSFVAKDFEEHKLCDEKLYAVLRYILTSEKRTDIYDDAEGLGNRLSRAAEQAETYEEFCSLAAAKRYTRARVKRLALNIAVNNTYSHRQLAEKPVNFVNLLAVADGKEDVLSQILLPVAVSRRTRARFADDFAVTARVDALFRAARYPYDDSLPFKK